jgi:hypothetical protein
MVLLISAVPIARTEVSEKWGAVETYRGILSHSQIEVAMFTHCLSIFMLRVSWRS